LPFVFRAKYWVGYFAKPKIQSNFPIKKYSYHLRLEHYLWRGIRLIKALNEEEGNFLEKEARNKNIVYPELICQEPSYFKNLLKEEKYLALAPISKWPDRQWPIENFREVIRRIFFERLVTKIVILGDKSEHDREFVNSLLEDLEDIPKDFFIDAVGKNSLSETIFLIKNSHLFLGLDSAPAHFAYLTAPRVLVIFITVDPLFRIPLTKTFGLIRCVHPLNCPKFPCYSGLVPSNPRHCQKCTKSITVEKVLKEAKTLL
jgi:ADP-heptose:LPS heptosyltransferase